MSYDLMVFDPDSAPRDREKFLSWYREQARWSEGHSYNDPRVCSAKLRAWFLEIINEYPAMNGPYAVRSLDDPDNPKVTDHCIGQSVIYSAFRWSQCRGAYSTVFELARKHGIGFYDASGAEGQVWLPDSKGDFVCIHSDPREPLSPEEAAEVEAQREEAMERLVKMLRPDR